MSIRYKISLILGSVLIGVVALNVVLAFRFILPSFEEIEKNKAKTNVERVLEAYNNEFEYLGSKTADWANWDDTYQFIVDKNSEYIESNLTDVSVENLKLDMMIFLDTEGKTVYQKGFDMDSLQPITDFSGWSEHIEKGAVMAEYEENRFKKGLLIINGRPVLFASRPILTSDAAGPNRGTIIFAKFFDDVEIDKLASLTKLDISFEDIDRQNNKFVEEQVQIIEIDEDNLDGYYPIKDYYDQPQLILKVKILREIYNQGIVAIKYFIAFSMIASLVLLLLISMMLDRVVIRRIVRYSADISKISISKDFSQRMAISGHDEISAMSTNTNTMFDSFYEAGYKLETEQRKTQAYLKVMETMLIVLDSKGFVSFANNKTKSILKIESDDALIGKNWFDNFIPKKGRDSVKKIFQDLIKGEENFGYNENLILTRDGEEKLIAFHNVTLKDGAGKIIGTVSSGDDITEKKMQEMKEKEQASELKKMNELMMGREMKMIELKKEIDDLKNKIR